MRIAATLMLTLMAAGALAEEPRVDGYYLGQAYISKANGIFAGTYRNGHFTNDAGHVSSEHPVGDDVGYDADFDVEGHGWVRGRAPDSHSVGYEAEYYEHKASKGDTPVME